MIFVGDDWEVQLGADTHHSTFLGDAWRRPVLAHGQARSGGSIHATENPSRSTFGSSFTRPPIWKTTTWACSSPTTSNEASLPRKGMWPTSASDWPSVSARSHFATGTTGSFGAR